MTDNMNTIWKRVHPRHVIWFLLVAIFGMLAWVGNSYADRMDAVEDWKREQNGHLRDISSEMRHIGGNVQEIRTEQRAMKTEIQGLRVDVEVIKERLED